jgi:hypothetical protein
MLMIEIGAWNPASSRVFFRNRSLPTTDSPVTTGRPPEILPTPQWDRGAIWQFPIV